eukprot:NODE_45_length_27728_cov_0.328387.p12 type:complete len:214 gc:universal NODE_45_length_27728_cov_0.328387:971-1612(+)
MGKKQMKIMKVDSQTDTKAGYIASEYKVPVSAKIVKPDLTLKAPLDPALHPRCDHCSTMDIDPSFFNTFNIKVCKNCMNEHEEIYALLTKTECKKDYLLTEPELKSLRHLEKVNPHRSHWFPMQLFVRKEVEEFAINKWQSLDKLDEEFYRRESAKVARKEEKLKKRLNNLRNGVRTNEWNRKAEIIHEHEFIELDNGKSQCDCGMELEIEEI